MPATETARLAVLIDADNASASVARELLDERSPSTARRRSIVSMAT